MADNWIIKQTIDLANPSTSPAHWLNPLLVNGDNEAHTWQVNVTRSGAPVDLTGAFVTCYIMRPRLGNALVVLGSVNGNVLSATFPKEAYYFEGDILAAIKYTDRQGATTTAAMLYAHVKRAIPADVIDPGGEILNLEQMLAMYYAMERGINAIENIQVDATTLPAGSPATAEASYSDDVLRLLLGIPHGAQGVQGIGGTSTITEVRTGEPGTPAMIEEAEGSTPENRKYIVTLPAGHDGVDGKDGKDGNDFILLGQYDTLEDLVADIPVGEPGAAYSVGKEPPRDVYLWDIKTSTWINEGPIKGPPSDIPGPQGPPGNLQYATFEIDFETRQLVMITPEGYEGVEWRINPETRQLEWGINTDIEPGQIGEQTGAIRTPLGGVILRPRGLYAETETYDRMDVVLHGSNSYVCINPIAGIAPGNTEYWIPMTNVPEQVDLSELADVALSGSYNDLKDKPEIPDLGTLAEVARTGDYEDLSNLPTIPGKVSDLANDAGFQTAAQVQTAITNVTSTIEADLSGYVPVSRKVAGKPLDADITLSASDVDAVPTTRTVNSKALSADIVLSASDVAALPLAGGTMTGTLTTVNPAEATAGVRNITGGTVDLQAGVSNLSPGAVHFVYE